VSLPITLRITRGAAPPPEPPPVGDWTFNNIPEGMVHRTTHDSSVLEPPGWSVSLQNADELPFLVSGTTPVGDQFVRQSFAGVTDAGDGPWINGSMGQRYAEYYYGSIQRFSPTWVWGTGHGMKLHVIHTGSLDPANTEYSASSWIGCGRYGRYDFTTTCFEWGDQMNRPSAGLWGSLGADEFFFPEGDPREDERVTQCPGTVGVPNGQWYKLEAHIKYSDPIIVKIWVNDVLVNDNSNSCAPLSPYSFPQEEQPGGPGVRQGATLGGGSGLGTGGVGLSSDYYIDYAVSTLYSRNP
jgi:hypothetical protein